MRIHWILQWIQSWFSLEGSLSLLMPPGLDLPAQVAGDMLAGCQEQASIR